jgi:tRNA(adenine34) deaminase
MNSPIRVTVHETFMEQCIRIARKALDAGEFPVGCVLVYNNEILVTGERSGTADGGGNEIDHAEMTALRKYVRLGDGMDPARISLYCNLEPCMMCYAAAMLHRIGTVVYGYEDVMGGATRCELKTLPPLYAASPIRVVGGVLREKSLELFKAFFSNPGNRYWTNSLLSDYTLTR